MVKEVCGARAIHCILIVLLKTRKANFPKTIRLNWNYIPRRGNCIKIVQTNAKDGFNVFKTATEQDAPTGNWLAKVKVGGATFEKRIKIETVMPNRLKIDLDFGTIAAWEKYFQHRTAFCKMVIWRYGKKSKSKN